MLLSKIDRVLSGVSARADRPRSVSPQSGSLSFEATAGIIGERYETIQGNLEQLASLAEAFRTFEPLLEEMRQPLVAEFEARRDDYLELISLRGAYHEQGQRMESLAGENRRLSAALSAVESRNAEEEAQREERAAAAVEDRLEIDRLRNTLSQAEARFEAEHAAGQDAAQRIAQFEQDVAGLREMLKDVETHRSEADIGHTRAVRDLALSSDENVALRKRLEETGAEVAKLARSEASLESQLTAERARAAADQAESARSLRVLEGQSEAIRSESAALQVKIDTATSRAERLEALNVDLSTRLAEIQTASQTADRRSADLQTGLYRALERITELETGSEDGRQRQATIDAARLAAVDRAENLSKASQAQEKALGRSEERVARLQAQITAQQAEHEEQVRLRGEQITELKIGLEGFRAESSMMTAALETARRERAGRDQPIIRVSMAS